MYGKHRYFFNTRMEAENALDNIERLASDYGLVTVDDVNEICGRRSPYQDNKNGWLEDSLKHVHIARGRYNYSFELPRPVPITADEPKNSYREDTNTTTVNPLCITIHTNELDNVDEVLAKTFKHISTIKDRMVNLTIM